MFCNEPIGVNLLKLKSGTKSIKNRDFSVKSGTLLKISPELEKRGSKLPNLWSFRDKIAPLWALKKWDGVKKRWDSEAFSIKKWDCPS